MYGLFVLPESLPPERRRDVQWRKANPVGSLVLLRSHPQLTGFAIVHFLYQLAHQSLQSVFVLYAGFRYGWGPKGVGMALAGVGVSFAIVQSAVIGPFVAKFGERRALLVGLLAGATGFLIYAVAPTGPLYMCGIPIMAFWGLYGPSSMGLMTRRVEPHEQGQLQGALQSVMGITGLLGPGLFTSTFAWFISKHRGWQLPGAPFLLSSSLLVIAAVIAWRITRPGLHG